MSRVLKRYEADQGSKWRDEGKLEGKLERQRTMAIRFRQQGISPEVIAAAAGVGKEVVAQWLSTPTV